MRSAAPTEVITLSQAAAAAGFGRTPWMGLSARDQGVFEQFGRGPIVSPSHACIHHAFEAHAAAYPNAIAACHGDEQITYQALDWHANALAAELLRQGVVPGDHVALFVQRSIHMHVGILAILKVGAAYVPQRVGVAPEAQLNHVIATAQTRVILTLSSVRSAVPVPPGHVCLEIDSLMATADVRSTAPRVRVSPSSGCFVLFTSGTTGVPNGVRITHKNVCDILLTSPDDFGMRPGLPVSQILQALLALADAELSDRPSGEPRRSPDSSLALQVSL